MGKASAKRTSSAAADQLRTFWDGRVVIDVSAADYDCTTQLADYWVRGIECGDTSGGNVIKVDHEDLTQSSGKRTNQSIFMAQGVIKAPLPVILKVLTSGTTVGNTTIALYYQRKRV
jgi:hypothetical protein